MGNVEIPHGSLCNSYSCEKICHTECSDALSQMDLSSQTEGVHWALGKNSLTNIAV